MPRLVVDLLDERPVWAMPDWVVDELRAALPHDWELDLVDSPADGRGDGGGPSDEALAAIRGAEVYFGFGLPRPLFEAACEPPARLRWAHSAAAGVGGSLYPEMRESDVRLTNSAGIHAEPIAETVIGMVLHFARGLHLAVRAQAERRWNKEPFESADTPVREIAGATLGIVGYGGIGRAVGRRAVALGMRVLALKRRPAEAPAGVELVFGDEGLERLLAESDFIALCVPETGSTHHLVDADALARMRPDAVLVNVARGGVLDQDALVRALAERRIGGAALDVATPEPLPPDSPLWTLDNVLVTPHVSATSHGFWRREADLMLENLRRYLHGDPLRNLVDKQHGY